MQRPTMLAMVASGVLMLSIPPAEAQEAADTVNTSGYLTYGNDATHARVSVFNSNITSGTEEPGEPCTVEVSLYDAEFNRIAQEGMEVLPQQAGSLILELPTAVFPEGQLRADIAYRTDNRCRTQTLTGAVELLDVPGASVVARHDLSVRATPELPPAPEPPAPVVGRPLTISLAVPREVWSGGTASLSLRYKHLKGWGTGEIELPPELTVISSIPTAKSVEDGVVRFDRLPSGAGSIRLKVAIAPGLAAGTRLESTATVVGEVGTPATWGATMTVR